MRQRQNGLLFSSFLARRDNSAAAAVATLARHSSSALPCRIAAPTVQWTGTNMSLDSASTREVWSTNRISSTASTRSVTLSWCYNCRMALPTCSSTPRIGTQERFTDNICRVSAPAGFMFICLTSHQGGPPSHWRPFLVINGPPTRGKHNCHGTCVGAINHWAYKLSDFHESKYDDLYHNCKHFVWELVYEYWGIEVGGPCIEISREIRVRGGFLPEITRLFRSTSSK